MQPVQYQQEQPLNGVTKRKCILLIFGIFHMLWALVILIMGGIIVGEFVMSKINKHSTAIWCSIIFATTGILSTIIYCLPRNKALIITHNVFAILSIFFAVAVIVAGTVGTDHYDDCKSKGIWSKIYPHDLLYVRWTPHECYNEFDREKAKDIYKCLIAFGILEMVCGIVSTIYSFRLYNCCRQSNCCKKCCDGCCEECKHTGYQNHSQAYQMQLAPVCQQQITQQQVQQPQQVQQAQIVTDANGQQYYLMKIQPVRPVQPIPDIQHMRSIQLLQPNQPVQPMEPMQPQVTLAETAPEGSKQNPPPYALS